MDAATDWACCSGATRVRAGCNPAPERSVLRQSPFRFRPPADPKNHDPTRGSRMRNDETKPFCINTLSSAEGDQARTPPRHQYQRHHSHQRAKTPSGRGQLRDVCETEFTVQSSAPEWNAPIMRIPTVRFHDNPRSPRPTSPFRLSSPRVLGPTMTAHRVARTLQWSGKIARGARCPAVGSRSEEEKKCDPHA